MKVKHVISYVVLFFCSILIISCGTTQTSGEVNELAYQDAQMNAERREKLNIQVNEGLVYGLEVYTSNLEQAYIELEAKYAKLEISYNQLHQEIKN